MEFCTFAAAPQLGADQAPDAPPPTSRIQVAVLADDFTDPRYGDFAITAEHVANWQRLLTSHFGGKVHIDLDHGTDYRDDSRAAGWIISLDQLGPDGETPTPDEVWALVEWTPLGVQKIRDREYQWISPTFTDDLVDNRGRHLGPALARAALTNTPFLREMATVSLSGGGLAHRRTTTRPGADSRGQMSELQKIAEALGLTADADEDKVLSAIGDLAAKATKATENTPPAEPGDLPKLLAGATTEQVSQALAAKGLVTLTISQHQKLEADAKLGVQAHEELRLAKFRAAIDKARAEGRLDATEDREKRLRAFYDAAPEEALAEIAALPKIVSLTARGTGGGEGANVETLPDRLDDGQVDTDRAEIHAEAMKLAADQNIDYVTAARQVMARRAAA